MNVLPFPNQALRQRIPDAVEVQFDLGRWCAALMSEGRLTKRHICADRAEAVATARELADKYGLRFLAEVER